MKVSVRYVRIYEKKNRTADPWQGRIFPAKDQLPCFFTQILHSGGENFTKDSYHEKR